MADVDPRLTAALEMQLRQWRALLSAGAQRIGWKLGRGKRESIGQGPVIGHLTSATQLEPGAVFDAQEVAALHADVEVAVMLARDVGPDSDLEEARDAIGGCGAALELVDLGSPPDDAQSIVAANVFHRAFVLGRLNAPLPTAGAEGRLVLNGEVRSSARASEVYPALVLHVAGLLGEMGERLRAGDCLITGSVVQVPIAPGDHVIADLGALGSAHAGIA